VLIVGSEVMSAITDWTDRNTCILFGDGAGAAVISASENDRGILSTHLRSDGALCDLIAVPGGGSRLPPSEKVVAERMQYIKMKGNETFKVAVRGRPWLRIISVLRISTYMCRTKRMCVFSRPWPSVLGFRWRK
jgi:3-oxoacyl-[acyl-carrier-protein] synthase III